MQDDTLSSFEPFEVLDVESLSDEARKTMLASEEKTTRAYLECRLSELRVRKGRHERAVTKMHVLMTDELMKDVDDFKNRVKYDHRIGDFRHYILEQCERFEWDLQELKHQLRDKLRENSDESKERKVVNQSVTTTDPHEVIADSLEANVDPHEANDDSHEANTHSRKANADTHEANTNPHEANANPHEANASRHETNDERHQTGAERYEINAEQLQTCPEQHEDNAERHNTTANAHESTAELHEEKAGRQVANAELHKASAERYKTNADPEEAVAVAHERIAELHEAIDEIHEANDAKAERHKTNGDPHETNAERHKGDVERQKANVERQRANDERNQENAERYVVSADQHKSKTDPHEANTNLHMANANPNEANADPHAANFDTQEGNINPNEANASLNKANANPNEAQSARQDTNVASTSDQGINKRPCQVCGMIPMNSQEGSEHVHELHKMSKASKSNAIGNNQELQPSKGEQPEPAARDASKASQELAVSIGVDSHQWQQGTNIKGTQEEPTRTESANHQVDATRSHQATSTKGMASRIEATNYTQQGVSCITNSHQTSKMTIDSPTCNGSTAEGIEISKSRPEGKEYANATTADDGYFHGDNKARDLPATANRSSIDLLLIGNCGNGKSATGNSILGKPAFRRNASSSVDSESSATTIMMGSTDVAGKVVNVIDGPSLNVFGNITPEELEKTIKNIHQSLELCEFAFTAVLIALKFGNRFTKQEVDAIRVIKNVLGKDVIREYGVCVITFGDAFDNHVEDAREDGEEVTFESWLHSQSGEVAKLFEECDFRCVLFDNVTKDANKKLEQLNKLMGVLPQGKRFSQEAFLQAWEGTHGLELEANLPVFLIEAQKEADIIAEMICHAEETKRLDPEAHKIKSKLSELKENVYAVRTKSNELERLQLFVLQLETQLNMKISHWRIEGEMCRNAGVPYAQSEAATLANKARKYVGNASYESHAGGFKEDMSGTAVFANSRSKNHSGFPKDSHAFSSSNPKHGERETTPWYGGTYHDSSVDTFGFVMVKNEKVPGASHESRYDVIKRRVLGFFKGMGLVSSTPTYQLGGYAYVCPPRQI